MCVCAYLHACMYVCVYHSIFIYQSCINIAKAIHSISMCVHGCIQVSMRVCTHVLHPYTIIYKNIKNIINLYICYSREYYHVLFSNLRVMIEAGDIIDEYFGPNGFG